MSAAPDILADMARSRGVPEDLTHQQITAIRDHLNKDLFAFAWLFFNYRDLKPDPHGEICSLLRKWSDRRLSTLRLMIQVPRGSYKTSLCTVAHALWQVCRNPDVTVLICNERVDNAKKWLRATREIASTNRMFQALYRDLLPPGIAYGDTRTMPRTWKWTDEELIFERSPGIAEASLTAAGVGTATTGGHWDILIKDDLVSEEAKNSDAVMDRAKSWLDSSFPLHKPPYKGLDLIVCTPWTHNDVYRYALEQYGYRLYRRSALETDPVTGQLRSLLPHQWSVNELLEEQKRRPYYFSAQMQCRPAAGKSQSFHPEWLRRFKVVVDGLGESSLRIHPQSYDKACAEVTSSENPPPVSVPLWWCNRALLVDPAALDANTAAKREHARTGLVVLAMDSWGRRFILDAWAGKADPHVVIRHMLRLCQEWQITRVGIEEVTFSILYRHWLMRDARQANIPISVVALKPKGRHKDDRIEALIPGFRQGLFYLNDTTNLQLLEQEYTEYPYGQYRDLLDALSYGPDVLRRPSTPEEQEAYLRAASGETGGISTRDEITGY